LKLLKIMKKKIEMPKSFQWTPDPYERQKLDILVEHSGITSGTQLIQAAITRWYNEIKVDYYTQKHGPSFESADHQ